MMLKNKFTNFFLLFGFFYIVAAASHSGFMAEHNLDEAYSLVSIIDGTAHRPWVYRQLVPRVADSIQDAVVDSNIPNSVKNFFLTEFNPHKHYTKSKTANTPGYEYSYRITYLLCFVWMFAVLFLLRAILLQHNFRQFESAIAPASFILALPYLQTIGGYFYDITELVFFAASIILVSKSRIFLFVLLTALATLNKESFLLFIPTLYPFIKHDVNYKKNCFGLILAFLIAAIINAYVKHVFQNNDGGIVVFQLYENINSYFSPFTYLSINTTYGLPGPKSAFIGTLVLVFIIFKKGGEYLPEVFWQHLKIAFVINVPFFILFCTAGELRNLSMLYIGFVVLMAGVIKNFLITDSVNYLVIEKAK